MTFAQLDALGERYAAEQEREDFRTAIIACHIYNSVEHKDKKKLRPADIFPEHGWGKPAKNQTKTPEERLEYYRKFAQGKK